MRELYLKIKPWAERSEEFNAYAQNKNGLNSRWNYLFAIRKGKNPEKAPFAYTSHIFSATAKISYLYWLNYTYGLDKEWLKTTAYPMIKGTVEFYRNFSNFYKGEDGKYHIKYTNHMNAIIESKKYTLSSF